MVAGATLHCDRYVFILTGPVVGLVTGDTARILLEVSLSVDRDYCLFRFTSPFVEGGSYL